MNAYAAPVSNSYVGQLVRKSGNRRTRRPYLRIERPCWCCELRVRQAA